MSDRLDDIIEGSGMLLSRGPPIMFPHSQFSQQHLFVGFHHGKHDHILRGRSDYAKWLNSIKSTMQSPGSPIVAVKVSPRDPGTRRINFLDLPSEVKNIIYFYLYRDRTKRAINLCLLSPAWKSPSPPTALMNTCSTIASEMMPLYFSNCLFTIDVFHKGNDALLEAAFKWLKKVGDKNSAQFRRLHIIHEQAPTFQYEIIISITDKKDVTIEQLKGPAKYLAERLDRDALQPPASRMRPEHKDIYSRLDRELTDDLIGTLTQRINTNETGALGVDEFEIILERIGFHLSDFRKCWQEWMVQLEAERRRAERRSRLH